VFAVTDLEIAGGSPRVQAEVRRALERTGRSLLRVSDGEIDRQAAAVPDVVSLTLTAASHPAREGQPNAASSCCAEGQGLARRRGRG
jgi:hypothetical protein